MSAQVRTIATRNNFTFAPTTLGEAMEYASMIASSCFCPASMKGKPGDVIIAIQMGSEVGLSPLQALQNIAVINGKPCLWGDAALAVVISSPQYVSHREWFEGSLEEGNLTAFCGMTRKGSEEHVVPFSTGDAKAAGLWTKSGVWQTYKARMLQMRARAFCMRDKFADALRGLNVREEVEDYQVLEKKKYARPAPVVKVMEEKPLAIEENPVIRINVDDMDNMLLDISQVSTMGELEEIYKKHYKTCAEARDSYWLKQVILAKDKRKAELERREFVAEMDENNECENNEGDK